MTYGTLAILGHTSEYTTTPDCICMGQKASEWEVFCALVDKMVEFQIHQEL